MNKEIEKILFDYLEAQKTDKEDVIQDLTKSINTFYNQREVQKKRKIDKARAALANIMIEYMEVILDTEFNSQEKEEIYASVCDTLKKTEPAITNVKSAMNDNDLIKSYIKNIIL